MAAAPLLLGPCSKTTIWPEPGPPPVRDRRRARQHCEETSGRVIACLRLLLVEDVRPWVVAEQARANSDRTRYCHGIVTMG
jgi:hypothetical protein